VAEGADVPLSHATLGRCPPALCVAAVLADAEHRVAMLGGREGMPRSLGSVYGGSVTRFLGGSFRGVVTRVLPLGDITTHISSVAVACSGSTLLVSCELPNCPTYDIHVLDAADGSQLRGLSTAGANADETATRSPRSNCGPRPTAACL
jgi:hypothetical protein